MIRKGTIVRLRRGVKHYKPCDRDTKNHSTATVRARLDSSGISGGLFLDRHIGGFRYWNIEDVERVSASEPRKRRTKT